MGATTSEPVWGKALADESDAVANALILSQGAKKKNENAAPVDPTAVFLSCRFVL
ncbi:hypothetical protein FTUN_3451 [Frigoriglobus tundricola]|uniref:Uncharacterized protein n=1 Tax=Frigoriglobus tundricola TaxID=2774151 RepID=A0A6M5YP97_9BACT|nr:hypothetical protein FTUN_3451 [Frigoriglobus tundricola]